MIKTSIVVIKKETGEEVLNVDATGLNAVEAAMRQIDLEDEYPLDSFDIDLIESENELDLSKQHLALPVLFKRFRRMADKTYDITFSTNPPTNENLLTFERLCDDHGVLLFKSLESISEEDVKLLDSIKEPWEKKRSPSQQVSDVLFLIWKIDNEGFEVYNDYYRFKMMETKRKLLIILDQKKQTV
jgi:hypothetical protein